MNKLEEADKILYSCFRSQCNLIFTRGREVTSLGFGSVSLFSLFGFLFRGGGGRNQVLIDFFPVITSTEAPRVHASMQCISVSDTI